MDRKRKWAAERYGMSRTFLGIVGRPIKVLDVENHHQDAVGYTSEGGNIHLSYEHEIMDGLNEIQKEAFRKGIFAHEMLHQIYTDFRAGSRVASKCSPSERRIFALISNVLEDPAIEFWAPATIGGPLLSSLRFAIAHTYKISNPLEESKDAFTQYINALIHFGDMGLLKGSFTFPEAKKCFAETANIFAAGIEEPNGAKRVEKAKTIMEMSRPLWEEMVKNEEAFEDFLNEILKSLSESGKSSMQGKGTGKTPDADEHGEESAKQHRRNITIIKVSKEEFDKLAKSSGNGSAPDGGDITVITCDEAEGNSSEGDSSEDGVPMPADASGDQKTPDSEVEDGLENKDSTAKPNEDAKSSEKPSQDNGNNNAFDIRGKKGGEKKIADKKAPDGYTPNEDVVATISEEEYELTSADIAQIERDAQILEREYEEKEAHESEDSSQIPDFPIETQKLGKRSCLNLRVKTNPNDVATLELNYQQLQKELSSGINSMSVQLKKIFENDKEEREYKTSGRIAMKRINSGKVTSRIFDRRRAPAGKNDTAIMLVVDESGSMSWNQKYISARNCCIALAEVFSKLDIPVYVMGFTADSKGYDVVHNHYITWKNSKADRLKLLNIAARANNCDGYSIRYATEAIKKRTARHKLMIVLSDGQPSSNRYYDGVADTRDAIRHAKKFTSLLGVAIGNDDTDTIYSMYGKDFLHVSEINDLVSGLSKKVKDLIRDWE